MIVAYPLRYRFVLAAGVLLLVLAACGAPRGAATSPEPTGELEGLNQDLILDNNSFEKVTPEPVVPAAMSQAEAQAQLPFQYALPAWAPPGFNLQDQVEVVLPSTGSYASVIVTWLNSDDDALHLQVSAQPAKQSRLGGAGNSQAVSVNGQPAVLVQGSSVSLGLSRLTLTWEHSGLSHVLSGDPSLVTGADLVRMAESIPEG